MHLTTENLNRIFQKSSGVVVQRKSTLCFEKIQKERGNLDYQMSNSKKFVKMKRYLNDLNVRITKPG